MPIVEERLAEYDATLQRYLRGEATSAEVAAADPYDDALRRMAERAYERSTPPRKEVRMKGWKFDWKSAIAGFVVGLMLMFIAGTLRPPA